MNPLEMPRLLTEALEKLGIAVERVRLEEHVSGGGLCTVKGRRIVYLDRSNGFEEDIKVLTEALHAVTDEDTYLPPAVREWLEQHQEQVRS